jgi:hypothetical protein
MIKHSGSKILVVMMAVAAFVGAWSTRGADNTGTVQGVVKDSSGQPVSGAFVKLKNTDRRLVFMVISQAQGRYTANNLPPGQYVVQGVGGENQSGTSSPVDVAAGGKATVDLSLTVQRAPALPNAWPGRPPGEQGGEAEGAMAAVNLPDGAGGYRFEVYRLPRCPTDRGRASRQRPVARDRRDNEGLHAGVDSGQALDGRGCHNGGGLPGGKLFGRQRQATKAEAGSQ